LCRRRNAALQALTTHGAKLVEVWERYKRRFCEDDLTGCDIAHREKSLALALDDLDGHW
jgi:hypothetical protein